MREDRSVLDLMTANYTYLNDRLARHYGIDGVYGNAFRRVELPDGPRNGLLGHGSILTVTSFSHRTSPVVRGAWILENLLGAPIPMPPDDVPALDENEALSMDPESMRVRLRRHRDDPACSGCHNIMDPIGFRHGEFRRDRGLAGQGRRWRADRRLGPPDRRHGNRRRGRSARLDRVQPRPGS